MLTIFYAVCDHVQHVGLKYFTGKLRAGHYLCRGGGGGKHRRGVKAISDCLDGEANLFFIKKFRGVCSLITQLNFTQNDLCATSDKNTNFFISKK